MAPAAEAAGIATSAAACRLDRWAREHLERHRQLWRDWANRSSITRASAADRDQEERLGASRGVHVPPIEQVRASGASGDLLLQLLDSHLRSVYQDCVLGLARLLQGSGTGHNKKATRLRINDEYPCGSNLST